MDKIKSFFDRHRKNSLFIFIFILCVILIIVSNNSADIQLKSTGMNVFSFFESAISSVVKWFSNTINSIGKLQQTQKELEETQKRLLEYEKYMKDFKNLQQENTQLKEFLDFTQNIGYKHIPAEIIAKQPGNTFALMTLNKGSKQGVKRFMPVVAQESGLTGLVGKVITVGNDFCSVIPLLNSSNYVAGRLERSRYDGLVGGQGEGYNLLLMQNISKDALTQIKYGDMVVTSGLGQVFPKGIYIGQVRTIKSQGYESSIELEIEPTIDLSRLEYVVIIDPGVQ